jgi:hypothetical protein
MADAFFSIREKIKRAEKHVGDFKSALARFNATQPYSLRVDTETDSESSSIQILRAEPVPPEIPLIAGDAIQNMRSTLDYLVCALVRANGKIPTRFNEFPIFDSPITSSKSETRFLKKVEGMRQEVIDAIRNLQPYHNGDNTLWRLHRLNVIDKHNMLVAVWGNITAVNGLPPITDQWNGNRWMGVPGVPMTLKQGDKFSIGIPSMKVDKSTPFFAEIVFNEPGVAEGYPAVLALTQFYQRVFSVVGELSWALK